MTSSFPSPDSAVVLRRSAGLGVSSDRIKSIHFPAVAVSLLVLTALTIPGVAFCAEKSDAAPKSEASGPASLPAGPADDRDPAPVSTPLSAAAVSDMRRAFADLGDSDAAVRDAALATLTSLGRDSLPVLLRLVEQSRPLLPSQAAVLRQIVTHVYLAGEPYDADRSNGFLGVKMHSCTINLELVPPKDNPNGLSLPRSGVVIVERIPGFIGNRLLRDGDVILAMAEKPDVQFVGQLEFTEAVRTVPPGQTVHFSVLRRGRVIKVPVALDPRPDAANIRGDEGTLRFLSLRKEKAEAYWRETFGRVLKEAVG